MITKNDNKKFDLNIDPLKNLIKSCDEEARRVSSEIKTRIDYSNIANFRNCAISVNN